MFKNLFKPKAEKLLDKCKEIIRLSPGQNITGKNFSFCYISNSKDTVFKNNNYLADYGHIALIVKNSKNTIIEGKTFDFIKYKEFTVKELKELQNEE
ncbi:MAG: hypothetical protein US20_C0023G0006 [Candidatus Pacebacteria bacterium GW2011_GWF1_36_5]|nr:MAG: hypothetical protein US20_C0023G0006 [Candidatus Pacebacteria bacterium GW2011_GWF1_36_5]